MLNKLKKSLAYRLPIFYKKILKYKRFKSAKKPSVDISVITMTGRYHIELTRLSILSLANKWSLLPKLTIYGDGTLSAKKIKEKLSFWKGEIVVGDWENVKQYHKELKRYALINYSEINPFGKKMALILYHAELHPTIWIDSDILFFKDLVPHIPIKETGINIGGSEDSIQAFDFRIIDNLKINFEKNYKFNAGLLYAFGEDIYEKFHVNEILSPLHPNYDFLTEQTIFAHIAKHSLGIAWNQDIIKNFHEDHQKLIAMNICDITARHYISNVRHLFWRDAFSHFKYLNKPN